MYKEKIKILTLKNQKELLKDITATAELTWGLIIGLAKNLSRFSQDVIQKDSGEETSILTTI